jgi:hypothetical protein
MIGSLFKDIDSKPNSAGVRNCVYRKTRNMVRSHQIPVELFPHQVSHQQVFSERLSNFSLNNVENSVSSYGAKI